jgi:acyl-CoA dehydrogenase
VPASQTPPAVTIPPETEAALQRARDFIAGTVIPMEQDAFVTGVDDKLRIRLQDAARAAGVLAPQVPAEFGGGGADFLATAMLLEAAGYSPLGPLAMNCAAPDEGNMHLLAMVATPAQQERYLRPLVAGQVRSCFAMTEPPPGAGSDPAALRSTARRTPDGWVLNGDKHFITGADGAAFAIVMVRAEGPGTPEGATMFLVGADNPGWQVGGRMRTIDAGTVGGHCQVRLRDAFVTDDAVLGEAGRGFAYAQVRLVPARLTHCMRWLGAAQRAHDVALRRTLDRELFGAPLGTLGMAQQLIADNEIELTAARALLWQVVAQVAQGTKGTEESSRAKVFISEATSRIVDRSVQLAGGAGVTEESVIGRIYADIRAFRIYDGPSEAHRAAIARRALARAASTAASSPAGRTSRLASPL